jgi:hypothetical protein
MKDKNFFPNDYHIMKLWTVMEHNMHTFIAAIEPVAWTGMKSDNDAN